MMNEGSTVGFEDSGQLSDVGLHDGLIGMHEGVEAEREIYGFISYHRQRRSVVHVIRDARRVGKALTAGLDAIFREIDDDQAVGQIVEKLGPAAVTTRDFQNSVGRDKSLYSWKDGAVPLHRRSAPPSRPFITGVMPIVRALPRCSVLLQARHNQRFLGCSSCVVVTLIPCSGRRSIPPFRDQKGRTAGTLTPTLHSRHRLPCLPRDRYYAGPYRMRT